ncbi:MAG: hypothetical protein VXV96_17995 [Bdellovibrionota bacterium]|nr:hypothetical protein [Bdellovibrionota bacterium]
MTKNSFFLAALIVCCSLLSCNDQQKSSELYSYPDWKEEVLFSQKGKDLFIFLTGDLKNNLYPHTELKKAGLPKELPHSIKVGGAPILKSYLDTIQKRLGSKSIVLSHGNFDLYYGDKRISSSLQKVSPNLKVDGLLIGPEDLLPQNHQSYAFDQMKDLNWLSSNILAIQTGKPTDQWNSSASLIFEREGIKVGVIGITSYELLGPRQRSSLAGYYFQDPVTSILRTKNQFKKEGVDFIILLHHGVGNCQRPETFEFPLAFAKLPETQKCDDRFEPKEILDRLPPGTLDLVLSNFDGAASFNHKGTPVIGQFDAKKFLTGIRVTLDNDKTDINNSYFLAPLKLCHQTFAGTKDCVLSTGNSELDEERTEILTRSSFHLLPAKFFGYEITEDIPTLKTINGR